MSRWMARGTKRRRVREVTDPVEGPEPELDELTYPRLGELVDGEMYQALADTLHIWGLTKVGSHGVGTFLDLLALTDYEIVHKRPLPRSPCTCWPFQDGASVKLGTFCPVHGFDEKSLL